NAGSPSSGRSFERSNVAGSCGSGTSSSENAEKRANSRRRPSLVASAMDGSMWSVKNWNGRRPPYSSPMNSIGVCGANRIVAALMASSSVAHLIVILRGDDETLRRRPLELPRERCDRRAVVGVVALVLAGEKHVKNVMELIRPLRIQRPLLDRT